MVRTVRLAAVAALLVLTLLPAVAIADPKDNAFARWGDLAVLGEAPHYLDLAVGVFDLRAPFDASERSAAGRVELREGKKLEACSVMAASTPTSPTATSQ